MVRISVSPLPGTYLKIWSRNRARWYYVLNLPVYDINVFAVARHASERYSSSKILILLAILLQAVGIDFGVARMLNYLLFNLPNSRTQELEGKNRFLMGSPTCRANRECQLIRSACASLRERVMTLSLQ
jgi:hypothetical protein